MIERIEVSMINETVHNFRKGEFGVDNIEIDENRGLIEVLYVSKEIGIKKVIIPLTNVEKIEYIDKNTSISMGEGKI
jgi:hypothetical protein